MGETRAARDLDSQQVEIIGRNWLVNEFVQAGYEVALPIRDRGVDILLSDIDYGWTLAIQMKTSRDRQIKVHGKYVGRNLLLAYVLLGERTTALPDSPDDAYIGRACDYSARLVLITPDRAWQLPTLSGKADADPDGYGDHRLAWTALVDRGLLRDEMVMSRSVLCGAVDAARQRLLAERKEDLARPNT